MIKVLCLSGLDPSGGAGIQADIEAIAASGAHALPVITCLTVQDTRNVYANQPVAASWLAAQLDALMRDGPIDAVKIGLLGDISQLEPISACLDRLQVPVVCDPVLRAGGGASLADEALIDAFKQRLLRRVTLLTPNASEARRLGGSNSIDEAAGRLLALGCRQVLVTGGDEAGDCVHNRWYRPGEQAVDYSWPRLPETFHGAGCTLASALAARLAAGLADAEAIASAQAWTQTALQQAYGVGGGRRIPNRIKEPRP